MGSNSNPNPKSLSSEELQHFGRYLIIALKEMNMRKKILSNMEASGTDKHQIVDDELTPFTKPTTDL